jgi:hypothetical protein
VIQATSDAHKIEQFLSQTWIAKAAQSLGLDLSNALACDPHLLSELPKRMCLAGFKTVAQSKYARLAVG